MKTGGAPNGRVSKNSMNTNSRVIFGSSTVASFLLAFASFAEAVPNKPDPATATKAEPKVQDVKLWTQSEVREDKRESVRGQREEAANRLGVEVAKHMGVSVNGEKSYAEQEADKKAEREKMDKALRDAERQAAQDRAEMEAAHAKARADKQKREREARDRAAHEKSDARIDRFSDGPLRGSFDNRGVGPDVMGDG